MRLKTEENSQFLTINKRISKPCKPGVNKFMYFAELLLKCGTTISQKEKNLTNWKLLPFQWRVIELRKEKEALNFIREEMLRQSCCLLTCLSMTRVLKQHRSLNEAFHRDGMSDVRQSNLPTCLILNSGVTPSVPDRIVLFGALPLVVHHTLMVYFKSEEALQMK